MGNLEKEVESNQDALDKATKIRQKELAEFNAEEGDLLNSISSLKAAIGTLSKHQGEFLQVPQSHITGVAATVQNVMDTHAKLLEGVITHKERKAISAFVQAVPAY